MDDYTPRCRAALFGSEKAAAKKLVAKTAYEDACDALQKLRFLSSEPNQYEAIVAQRAACKVARAKYEQAILHARNADDELSAAIAAAELEVA